MFTAHFNFFSELCGMWYCDGPSCSKCGNMTFHPNFELLRAWCSKIAALQNKILHWHLALYYFWNCMDRMSRVCCRWRDIASEPRLWKTVNLSTSELNIRTSATILQKLASSRIKFTRVLFLRGWSKLTDKGIEVSWLYGWIMFSTVDNVDRYIGRHSIDIVINSRLTEWSTIGQVSVNISSTHLDQILVICRWYVSQLSVICRSTIGGISVNCRSHISPVLI